MFSLTLREQLLVGGILFALVTGQAVKHWRDARREIAPVVVAPSGSADARRAAVP